MSSSGIENTTTTALKSGNPLFGLPGVIEASEARGQAEVVASAALPTKSQDPREHFEALGFTFGEPFKDDGLFCPATLPEGWTKCRTDHSMWSHIVDEKGRVRVEVLYKAAFYDREAFMRLTSRYSIRGEFSRPAYDSVHFVVRDGEEEIHRTRTFRGEKRAVFDAEDALRAEACAWLEANRPGWNDPVKAWL